HDEEVSGLIKEALNSYWSLVSYNLPLLPKSSACLRRHGQRVYVQMPNMLSMPSFLKAKEADCVKAVIDNQKTPTTKPAEITPPSPTQSSSQIVAIEPEEPAEEDMNTFFTSLDSELSSSRIVYSKEEAKEALAKINEALNITPIDLNDLGKFSPLKQAFMILARFDCASTTLTIEQKNELLRLEERLKELANQTAKAVQDKDQTAKESIKRTMTCNL
ncbi:hypothetical protein Godav_023990, partial [Gossypium davidsonii]|nr:hypothetical protein [Gossypium davidsonii]